MIRLEKKFKKKPSLINNQGMLITKQNLIHYTLNRFGIFNKLEKTKYEAMSTLIHSTLLIK